jgi:hypothetical protein
MRLKTPAVALNRRGTLVVNQGKIKFGEGDMLRVRLQWKIERKARLIQRNVIVKVYEVMEREKQLLFDLKPSDSN